MCLFNSGQNLPAKKRKLVKIRPEKYEGKNLTMWTIMIRYQSSLQRGPFPLLHADHRQQCICESSLPWSACDPEWEYPPHRVVPKPVNQCGYLGLCKSYRRKVQLCMVLVYKYSFDNKIWFFAKFYHSKCNCDILR